MARDLAQLTRSTVKILRATELDQLPDDGTESFGVAMEHVVLFQADEIEQLRAIVGEMEKTADGVRVVRGMKVYSYDPVGYLQGYDVGGHSAMSDSSIPSPAYLLFSHNCYSTPEAAEAAAQAAE